MIHLLIPASLLLFFDFLYLKSFGNSLFGPMVRNIQKQNMVLSFFPSIIAYIFIFFILYFFILLPRLSPLHAFLLGASVYGVFDFTNLAIFSNYQYFPAIIDTIWGGILFYITTFITYYFYK